MVVGRRPMKMERKVIERPGEAPVVERSVEVGRKRMGQHRGCSAPTALGQVAAACSR